MNINEEDVKAASELNNNISAGSAVMESSGCGDKTVSNRECDHVQQDSPTNSVVAKGYEKSVESGVVLHCATRVSTSCVADEESRQLDPTQGATDLEVTATCPEGKQGQLVGGQRQSTDNNDHKTPGVYCNSEPDSQTKEESNMRNCSCDEGSLCFCPTSFFNGSSDRKEKWQLHKTSLGTRSPAVIGCKQEREDMEAVSVDEGMGSKRVDDDNEKSEDEEDVRQCKRFMEDLVDRIFNNSASICQKDNAKFGEYCQLAIGRLWFARLVDSQRVNSKKVTEQTFYRLVQFFAVCLFECKNADDFTPVKSLMNMCFTFYHEHEGFPRSDETTRKSFLYSHLTEQPIWKSLRFWNAAFFDAVHQERKQRAPDNQVNWRHLSSEEREDNEVLNENITFGQLATFLHNMMELELSKDMCQQFLDKMATIGNLSADQVDLIQTNIRNHFQSDSGGNTKNKKHHTPFNRLSLLKRKGIREATS